MCAAPWSLLPCQSQRRACLDGCVSPSRTSATSPAGRKARALAWNPCLTLGPLTTSSPEVSLGWVCGWMDRWTVGLMTGSPSVKSVQQSLPARLGITCVISETPACSAPSPPNVPFYGLSISEDRWEPRGTLSCYSHKRMEGTGAVLGPQKDGGHGWVLPCPPSTLASTPAIANLHRTNMVLQAGITRRTSQAAALEELDSETKLQEVKRCR